MTPMDDRTAAATMTALHAEHERWLHRYCFTRHEDWHPGESRDVLDAAIGRIRGKMAVTEKGEGVGAPPPVASRNGAS